MEGIQLAPMEQDGNDLSQVLTGSIPQAFNAEVNVIVPAVTSLRPAAVPWTLCKARA